MKRLIVVFVTSFFVLMIIWLFVGYSEYGDEILNKHLDLQTMIYRLDDIEIDIFDFIENLRKFADHLKFNGDVPIIADLFAALLRPIIALLDIIHVISKSIITIILFVFQPVFY